MAMTVTVAQVGNAVFGSSTTFVATVANSSGGNVNLNALTPRVNLASGQIYLGATIGQAYPSAQTSVAQNGGYQFNVIIPASGSVAFTFAVDFGCSPIAGATAVTPSYTFFVSVDCFSSDGSSFSGTAPATNLNLPTFGPANAMGSPINQWPGSFPTIGTTPTAPGAPGTLDFQNVFNSGLAL